uniref:ORF_03R n=1 Tax=Human herpesvirus 1 (strain R15) TaxID=36345 RepID=Q6VB59_HHV1R|nr:ORF_03R [Human alphaherpesvirus 1 strain R-15]
MMKSPMPPIWRPPVRTTRSRPSPTRRMPPPPLRWKPQNPAGPSLCVWRMSLGSLTGPPRRAPSPGCLRSWPIPAPWNARAHPILGRVAPQKTASVWTAAGKCASPPPAPIRVATRFPGRESSRPDPFVCHQNKRPKSKRLSQRLNGGKGGEKQTTRTWGVFGGLLAPGAKGW